MSGSNVCASFMLMEPLPVTASACVPVKAAVPVTCKLVSGPVICAEVRCRTPSCSDARNGPTPCERDALQRDVELVDLHISAKLLWLPQWTGNVDRAPDGGIAADTLHMKGAQKRRDVEVGQHHVGLGLESCPGGLSGL